MRKRIVAAALLAFVGTILAFTVMPAAGQDEEGAPKAKGKAAKTKGKSAPTPRRTEGKVDFAGIWSADRTFIYDIQEPLTLNPSMDVRKCRHMQPRRARSIRAL